MTLLRYELRSFTLGSGFLSGFTCCRCFIRNGRTHSRGVDFSSFLGHFSLLVALPVLLFNQHVCLDLSACSFSSKPAQSGLDKSLSVETWPRASYWWLSAAVFIVRLEFPITNPSACQRTLLFINLWRVFFLGRGLYSSYHVAYLCKAVRFSLWILVKQSLKVPWRLSLDVIWLCAQWLWQRRIWYFSRLGVLLTALMLTKHLMGKAGFGTVKMLCEKNPWGLGKKLVSLIPFSVTKGSGMEDEVILELFEGDDDDQADKVVTVCPISSQREVKVSVIAKLTQKGTCFLDLLLCISNRCDRMGGTVGNVGFAIGKTIKFSLW